LTEQLIELAAKHNYVFDQEEFNFVAIRDRIRCYYKSYVQTARKRGLSIPDSNPQSDKRVKTGHGYEDGYSSEDHDDAYRSEHVQRQVEIEKN
jgi:hypothetical protein